MAPPLRHIHLERSMKKENITKEAKLSSLRNTRAGRENSCRCDAQSIEIQGLELEDVMPNHATPRHANAAGCPGLTCPAYPISAPCTLILSDVGCWSFCCRRRRMGAFLRFAMRTSWDCSGFMSVSPSRSPFSALMFGLNVFS